MRLPDKEALTIPDFIPKTYEEISVCLRSNHFYPATDRLVGESGETVTGLSVEAQPIRIDDIAARIEEILKGSPVKIQKLPNLMLVQITLKKKR